MADVTCLGILVADVVGKPVDAMPERGKLMLVDHLELHGGGCANSTGIGLAKIGVKTAVIGKVGNDGFGDFMISNLSRSGVDCAGVVRDARGLRVVRNVRRVVGQIDEERPVLVGLDKLLGKCREIVLALAAFGV